MEARDRKRARKAWLRAQGLRFKKPRPRPLARLSDIFPAYDKKTGMLVSGVPAIAVQR